MLRFGQNWPAGYNNGFLKHSLLTFEAEQSLPQGRRVGPLGNRNDDAFYLGVRRQLELLLQKTLTPHAGGLAPGMTEQGFGLLEVLRMLF